MQTNIKKRIFITGGTGFFGKTFLAEWKLKPRKETELVILSRDSHVFLAYNPAFRDLPGVTFVDGDVRTFTFPSGDFTTVIHAATPATLLVADAEMEAIIVEGTGRVLDFCKAKRIEKLLYISSGAVYGKQTVEMTPMTESFSCCPVTTYGKSKLIAERMCLHNANNCAIARCFTFIGEYLPLNLHFAIGNFIHDCLLDRPILIHGDGRTMRSYLYSSDLVRQLWALLDCPMRSVTVNIGSDQAISIRELAEVVRCSAGTNNEIIVCKRVDAHKTIDYYVPDITSARYLLKTDEPTSLETALGRVFSFHRQQQ